MRWMLALVLIIPSFAEVTDSAANGFTVKMTFQIQASPDDVYSKLVHNIGDWWSADHTYSHNAHNLTMDDKPGGCFCETLPRGGGVRHLTVAYAAPGQALTLTGTLGPLLSLAAAGSMSITLAPANGGTKLDVTYTVAGYTPKGMDTWAAPVDTVLKQQFASLKSYVEQGAAKLK